MENKIAWEKYPEGNKREEVFQFAENYRKFISDCKTERECVTSFVEKAEKAGFVNLEKDNRRAYSIESRRQGICQ